MKAWHYGPFVQLGHRRRRTDRTSNFSRSASRRAKCPSRALFHAGILSGQFELAGNIMPFWQSYTPAAAPADLHVYQRQDLYCRPLAAALIPAPASRRSSSAGISLTKSHRIQPWFQAAGGLIYTTHKFPPDVLVPHGAPGATSVWNFSPQGGVGIHYFLRSKRSIDFGVNAVHISSASLGDHNPGVNASIQLQVGYTWWK